MRIRLIALSLTASGCLLSTPTYSPVFGQNSYTQPRSAKLLARRMTAEGDNYVNAAFSFEHGINGEDGKLLTGNDWDLLFGNGPDADVFDVTTVTDDCSRILDLGDFSWDSNLAIPELPAHPEPTREPSVKAIVGHMYLVHTRDRDSDLYALFRVEELEPGKSVTISWKLVPTRTTTTP